MFIGQYGLVMAGVFYRRVSQSFAQSFAEGFLPYSVQYFAPFEVIFNCRVLSFTAEFRKVSQRVLCLTLCSTLHPLRLYAIRHSFNSIFQTSYIKVYQQT